MVERAVVAETRGCGLDGKQMKTAKDREIDVVCWRPWVPVRRYFVLPRAVSHCPPPHRQGAHGNSLVADWCPRLLDIGNHTVRYGAVRGCCAVCLGRSVLYVLCAEAWLAPVGGARRGDFKGD